MQMLLHTWVGSSFPGRLHGNWDIWDRSTPVSVAGVDTAAAGHWDIWFPLSNSHDCTPLCHQCHPMTVLCDVINNTTWVHFVMSSTTPQSMYSVCHQHHHMTVLCDVINITTYVYPMMPPTSHDCTLLYHQHHMHVPSDVINITWLFSVMSSTTPLDCSLHQELSTPHLHQLTTPHGCSLCCHQLHHLTTLWSHAPTPPDYSVVPCTNTTWLLCGPMHQHHLTTLWSHAPTPPDYSVVPCTNTTWLLCGPMHQHHLKTTDFNCHLPFHHLMASYGNIFPSKFVQPQNEKTTGQIYGATSVSVSIMWLSQTWNEGLLFKKASASLHSAFRSLSPSHTLGNKAAKLGATRPMKFPFIFPTAHASKKLNQHRTRDGIITCYPP